MFMEKGWVYRLGLERGVAQDIVVRELFEYDAYLTETWWPEPRTLLSVWKTSRSRVDGQAGVRRSVWEWRDGTVGQILLYNVKT